MWKIKGKTQMTVVVMTLITLALILYRLSTSDVLVDPYTKERNIQSPVLVSKFVGEANGFSPVTGNPVISMNDKHIQGNIMDDIREKNVKDVGRIQNQHVSGNLGDANKFNSESITEQKNILFSGHHIVHLDLKGAPPRVSYYEELFPLLQTLGATGILMEYEDMFPYSGVLHDLSAYNAYSRSDVRQILKVAHKNGLDVIPLIQTFGHLEFVLKLKKFSHLREVSKYPQVICPSHNETFPLLTAMIDEIIELHPDIKYLHIGCDEVYYLGNCIRCGTTMVNNKWTKSQLFLNHVVRVAKYIRKYYPRITPLTWDDEFRTLSDTELQESEVARWLEPVIWKYSPDVSTSIGPDVWEKYISLFPAVWVASAFKGATGPDKYITDISYHLENHRAWMEIVSTYARRMKFKGIMLTGWQRYDHFAVLCELLPVGLPSLATNLAYLHGDNKEMVHIPGHVLDVLKCDQPFPISPGMGRSHCGFPGAGILEAAERLNILEQNIDHDLSDSTIKGWFTLYNIEHIFSSPSHVERGTAELGHWKMELMYIEKDMQAALSEVYDHYTVTEWISTYIHPLDTKLQNLWDAREKVLAQNYWPRRPLDRNEPQEGGISKVRTDGT